MIENNFYEIGIIVVAIVYVWNHSGFIYDLSKSIYKMLNPTKGYLGQQLPKPIGCSLCMVFWIVLLYATFQTELNIIYSVGISVASAILSVLTDKIFGLIFKLINKIQ